MTHTHTHTRFSQLFSWPSCVCPIACACARVCVCVCVFICVCNAMCSDAAMRSLSCALSPLLLCVGSDLPPSTCLPTIGGTHTHWRAHAHEHVRARQCITMLTHILAHTVQLLLYFYEPICERLSEGTKKSVERKREEKTDKTLICRCSQILRQTLGLETELSY
jgi:hypothetical protein